MDPRDRVLGPIAVVGDHSERAAVDFGDLFPEACVVRAGHFGSIRLKEIPLLVQKFGYGGVKELLKSGRVRILCDAPAVGQIGQTLLLSRARKGALPLGSYSFSVIQIADRNEYIHQSLEPIKSNAGANSKTGTEGAQDGCDETRHPAVGRR